MNITPQNEVANMQLIVKQLEYCKQSIHNLLLCVNVEVSDSDYKRRLLLGAITSTDFLTNHIDTINDLINEQ